MKTRREFLKNSCAACLGSAFLGLTFTQLTSCSPFPVYKTALTSKSVSIPVSSFAESNLVIVRDMQVAYDILLVKKSESEYNAIYMKCSHQENPVTATKNGLFCSSHGSRFDLDGNVTKEPALEPLKKFKTSIDDNQITIDLNS
ncbi:MAG: ubiquinol-cytochrome c reductase iron-sulfur subunit [Bacteroidota bacterium]